MSSQTVVAPAAIVAARRHALVLRARAKDRYAAVGRVTREDMA
jgi:hypothetical protein